jgi:hypothetical protein
MWMVANIDHFVCINLITISKLYKWLKENMPKFSSSSLSTLTDRCGPNFSSLSVANADK